MTERTGFNPLEYVGPDAVRDAPRDARHDVLRLCLRLCFEPTESHSPETQDVLKRWRPAWEAAAAGLPFYQALAFAPSETAAEHIEYGGCRLQKYCRDPIQCEINGECLHPFSRKAAPAGTTDRGAATRSAEPEARIPSGAGCEPAGAAPTDDPDVYPTDIGPIMPAVPCVEADILPHYVDDGYGNGWECAKNRPTGVCGMQIVRPGKVQCECFSGDERR